MVVLLEMFAVGLLILYPLQVLLHPQEERFVVSRALLEMLHARALLLMHFLCPAPRARDASFRTRHGAVARRWWHLDLSLLLHDLLHHELVLRDLVLHLRG